MLNAGKVSDRRTARGWSSGRQKMKVQGNDKKQDVAETTGQLKQILCSLSDDAMVALRLLNH